MYPGCMVVAGSTKTRTSPVTTSAYTEVLDRPGKGRGGQDSVQNRVQNRARTVLERHQNGHNTPPDQPPDTPDTPDQPDHPTSKVSEVLCYSVVTLLHTALAISDLWLNLSWYPY